MVTISEAYALARQHHRAGRPAEAETLYRSILEASPDQPETLAAYGALVLQAGRHGQAVELLERAHAARPDLIPVRTNLAIACESLAQELQRADRTAQAEALYRRALALNPARGSTHTNLAALLWSRGAHDGALEHLGHAAALDPDVAERHMSLGNVLFERGRPEDAAEAFRRVIALRPDDAEYHHKLGNALLQLGRTAEATACYRRAIAHRPDYAAAFINLGYTLKLQGDHDAALACYRQALALDPGNAHGHYNLGIALQSVGRHDEAEAAFRAAIAVEPGHVAAHHLLGRLLLLRGKFAEGNAEYEWRPNNVAFRKEPERWLDAPMWDGRPIPDGAILIVGEGGFGDAIHYVRYAARVAGRCRQVVVVCHKALARLFGGLIGTQAGAGGRILVNPAEPPPVAARAMFLSLPHLMGTTLDTVPADIPYLKAEPDPVRLWADRLASHPGLKVGLVWAGGPGGEDDHRRSLTLASFAPLASVPGVTLFSIQKGPTEGDADDPPAGMRIVNLSPHIHDFADTAAILENLDLTIAVDTSVVHLAGALGRPVWTLVSFFPDYRWLLDRDDSPWYPSLRLFRQPAPGTWAPVVERVRRELAALAAARAAGGAAGE